MKNKNTSFLQSIHNANRSLILAIKEVLLSSKEAEKFNTILQIG
ncbi:MAG TPA: hypothetical protein VGA21_13680 [Cyclobacteriaceae bacterium]|jgi:hypothetical protein